MPLQNRVLPTGEVIANPARGLLTGNRGILHRPDRSLGPARWTHPHWVCCTLHHPRDVYHGPMPERAWTALFFLDEAVALAAGHRPCGYCRRTDYRSWVEAWSNAFGPTGRRDMDKAMHKARVARDRSQIRHEVPMETLPDGTFVLLDGAPHLVASDRLLPFTPNGYGPERPRGTGNALVLTPSVTVEVLRQGYSPILHLSAAPAPPRSGN